VSFTSYIERVFPH